MLRLLSSVVFLSNIKVNKIRMHSLIYWCISRISLQLMANTKTKILKTWLRIQWDICLVCQCNCSWVIVTYEFRDVCVGYFNYIFRPRTYSWVVLRCLSHDLIQNIKHNSHFSPRHQSKPVIWPNVADPGCLSRIRLFPSRSLDPNFFHPGSASKNLSIITQKNGFRAKKNMI
jgi:hypothetical protein